MELYELTLKQAGEYLAKGEVTSVELTEALFERIKNHDSKIESFITVDEEGALNDAQKADEKIKKGEASKLTGIPLSIKDLICTKGLKTTCASKILENFIPPYDATVMEKLKDHGIVIQGKVNMDEFAMGSTTEFSGFKPTKNPWDTNRFPGGSSGGSAASVAAQFCYGSLGSDTGGSIRQPASHCGVVGLKPTYGRVSRYGLVAFASSLDQIGPLTKTVEDSAILLNGIAGYDSKDSTSVPVDLPDFTDAIAEADAKGLKGMTIGIPAEYNSVEGVDADVKKAVDNGVKVMESLGAKCVEVSLPHTEYAIAAYYVIATSEASSNLARFDGVKYGIRDKSYENLLELYQNSRSNGFGIEVQRRIIIGTYALSSGYYDAYYKKASQVRTLIANDFKKVYENCDILLSPVAPSPAGIIGADIDDPLKMYLSDIFTLSANLAGIPGISVPCGFSDNGLPVGLQLLGKHFDEYSLLKAGHCFEKALNLNSKFPEL